MDQQQNFQKFHSCLKHVNKNLEFIQVNQIISNPTSNIFCCTQCVNEDLNFKGVNYLLIEQIVEQAENKIIQKWPPVNDYSVIEKLIQETSKFDQSQHMVQRITNYFTALKDEVIKRIECIQKNMMNHALDLPFGKNQIIKQYQQISQIGQLQSMIVDSQNDKSFFEQASQEKFKNFIKELELKKVENTQKLQNLLEQSTNQQSIINYELPNLIKQSILSFVDKINFFNSELISNNNNNFNETENYFSKTLMGLISNKSNFCSKEFLNKVEKQLEQLNSLFESVSTNKIFIEGKKPIQFELLCDQKMESISNQTQHLIKLQTDSRYQKQIYKSSFIQQIQKILQNKLNFVNINQQKIIIDHLIESFGFLKYDQNSQIIQQQENFELFSSLDTQAIDIITSLVKKQQEIRNSMDRSLTYQVKNKYQFNKFQKDSLERILSKFPIFDIISLRQQNILNEIQLVKSYINDGNQRIQITKNGQNQLEITINEEQYNGQKINQHTDCMSNIILQKDKKYIFRVQFQKNTNQTIYSQKNISNQTIYFQLGLMQHKNFNFSLGFNEKLCTEFKIENNKLQLNCQSFTHFLKGTKKYLPVDSIIELRVWLKGSIFQLTNYPQNDFVVSIQNQQLMNLQLLENMSFFVQLRNSNKKYIITEALVVEEYDD